jgi:hypothetical protein
MRMLIGISAALVALAVPGVAAAQEPFTALAGDASATESGRQVAPRVLPTLELGAQRARMALPPAGASNASLLLERGVFRPLPDVPGALQTTHLRNNNRGAVVGAYADDSDGTLRLRGFLLQRRRVTRIDVPGAAITLPLGINDRGQVVGGWVGPDAAVNPATGETGPVHGFLWEKGRFTKFDVPGATTTAGYEINNRAAAGTTDGTTCPPRGGDA